jgi:hypothetical protein
MKLTVNAESLALHNLARCTNEPLVIAEVDYVRRLDPEAASVRPAAVPVHELAVKPGVVILHRYSE